MSDLDRTAFRKSSHSEGANGCVETAVAGRRHLVRDSKNPGGEVLVLDRAAWSAFIRDIKSGDHDL